MNKVGTPINQSNNSILNKKEVQQVEVTDPDDESFSSKESQDGGKKDQDQIPEPEVQEGPTTSKQQKPVPNKEK